MGALPIRGLQWRSVKRRMNAAVSGIRMNAVRPCTVHGRAMVIKRRTALGRCLTPVANMYWRLARVPLFFFTKVRSWQDWEVKCFRMLNPDFHAARAGSDAICEEQLPGQSLWHHAQQGSLTTEMLRAAGREFARAHHFWSDIHHAPWSHGDGAMRNVMYEGASGRARLIDFEVIHDPALPAVVRHANDLAALLLDLASIALRPHWLPCALAFIEAYDDPAVIAEVDNQLNAPGGLGGFWWQVRTNFADAHEVAARVTELRLAVYDGVGASAGASAEGATRRASHRPSSHCQETSPGTENASSRTRRIIAAASNVFGGVPNKIPINR